MLELMHLANLMSSANKNGSADRILSGSLLLNNSGPSTLPCGDARELKPEQEIASNFNFPKFIEEFVVRYKIKGFLKIQTDTIG